MLIGKQLRALRRSRGWKQNLVAAKTGFDQARISKYENDAEEPMMDALKKLADVYEVSVEYFTGQVEAVKRDDTYLEEILERWRCMTDEEKEVVARVVKLITKK